MLPQIGEPSVVIHDVNNKNSRYLSPIKPAVRFSRHRIVVRNENQPFRVNKIDSQLALSVRLEFVAAGCRNLSEVFERVRRFDLREPLLKNLRTPITEPGAHLFGDAAKLLDLP